MLKMQTGTSTQMSTMELWERRQVSASLNPEEASTSSRTEAVWVRDQAVSKDLPATLSGEVVPHIRRALLLLPIPMESCTMHCPRSQCTYGMNEESSGFTPALVDGATRQLATQTKILRASRCRSNVQPLFDALARTMPTSDYYAFGSEVEVGFGIRLVLLI